MTKLFIYVLFLLFHSIALPCELTRENQALSQTTTSPLDRAKQIIELLNTGDRKAAQVYIT